ncbi:MAG: phage tail tape measure protein, partial [Sarcina sp.]
RAIGTCNKKIDTQTIKMNEAKISIERTKKAIEENNKALEKMGDKFAKAGEKAGKISDKMKPISTGIVGVGIAAGTMSAHFDDSMAKVSTIADTTKVPIDKLKDGVMDLSNQTGMSVNDLSEGLYQAISASVDTGDAVNFLGTATKAAKGGFTDTATAVDGLSTVLNSYGLESSKANEIANQMLITQNKGKTSFGELASSVGKVTPIASQLGVSTKELFSSLASTTAQGLATAESVTALKAAMSNVIKPSKEAADAAEALGIKFNVSELKSKGWMPFLQDLKKGLEQASPEFESISNAMQKAGSKMEALSKAGKTNTKEYKQAKKEYKDFSKELDKMAKMADSPISAMATMFGSVEGLNSILMLTSDNGMNIYNDTMKEMDTNTTALDDAFNKMNNSTGQQFKNAMNEGKNALIGFGDVLSPFIIKFAHFFSGITKIFNGMSKGQKEFIVGAGSLFVATNVALGGFSKLTKGIKGNIKVLKDLPSNTRKSIKSIKDFSKGVSSGAKNVGNFAKSVGKIGWQGFSKGASLASKGIKGLGKGLLTGVKAVGRFTLSLAKMIVQLTIAGAKIAFNTAKLIAQKVALIATTVATKAMELAQAALNLVMSLNPITIIIGLLVALGATFVILYNKCEWFRNGVNAVWNGIKTIFSSFASFLSGAFTRDWTQSLGLLGVPLNALFSVIGSVWNGVKGVFHGVLEFLQGVFTGNWHMIFSGLGNIVKSIFGALGGIIKAPINAAISGINWVVSKVNGLSFDVPDWVPGVGGKHFGINLPSIPALAEGGIVTKATLALVGEGKEHEAVIPLSKLNKLVVDGVSKALEKKKSNTNMDSNELIRIATVIGESIGSTLNKNTSSKENIRIEIPINLDSREIARLTAPQIDKINGKNMSLNGRLMGI